MENENTQEQEKDKVEFVNEELRNAGRDFIRKFGGEEFKSFLEVMKGQDDTIKLETLKVLMRFNMGMSSEFNPLLVLTGWSAKVAIDIPKYLESYLTLFKAGLIEVSNKMTVNMKQFEENVENIFGDRIADLNELVHVIRLIETTIMAQQNDVLALAEAKKKDISEHGDNQVNIISSKVIEIVGKAVPNLYRSVKKEMEASFNQTKRLYFMLGCVFGGFVSLGILSLGIEIGKRLA